MQDVFTIANKNFKSRLIVGTGKYKDFKETADAVKASDADIVTVAVRRVNISDKNQPLLNLLQIPCIAGNHFELSRTCVFTLKPMILACIVYLINSFINKI